MGYASMCVCIMCVGKGKGGGGEDTIYREFHPFYYLFVAEMDIDFVATI